MIRRRVLLIGWDAADWKVIRPLMQAGRMPNVKRLVENGASGPMATLHPPLSPMLWTSIATGKRPYKHGIHGFTEPTPDGFGIQPVSNLSRRSKALWNILNQNGLRSVVIGWWPSHPAEPINGVMISDQYHRAHAPLSQAWPLAENTVHPAKLADALRDRRVHPEALAPELVERFVPLAREIDQDKDKRLAGCMRTLAECLTISSAAEWLLENEPWDFFAVYFDAIDHFGHGFMRYHPPRQSWISPRDFELYSNVISTAYQLHDELLGKLLAKAGDDATVLLLSDHGFHPDHLRPHAIPDIPAGPAIEHRDYGILAMSGPGIRKNEMVHGASLLDVAPTVLALYGLAVGEDMDGKVLSQAIADTPEAEFIPSWEDVAGEDGQHPPHTRLDPVAAVESLGQLVALGYIDKPDEDRELAVRKTVDELRYNLGEAYQDAGRHPEAYEIFRELYAAHRDDMRFATRLFASCQALGRDEEMRRIVQELDGQQHQPAVVDYLKVQVLIAEKRYEDAAEVLEHLGEAQMVHPLLLLQAADLCVHLGRWRDADAVYQKALEADPDNARAHLGLCRTALRRKQYSRAAQSALEAIERTYQDPMAHYLLGLALSGMKDYVRAAEAMRAAISWNPNFPEAHVRLARMLEKRLGDPEGAREHRRLAGNMRAQK